MAKVRRFMCSKCGKRLTTMERRPEKCGCDKEAVWLPQVVISREYKQMREGWRRVHRKVKMSKKERRKMRYQSYGGGPIDNRIGESLEKAHDSRS